MSFSATSGYTITQAGTDSDLSGLSSLGDVNVNTIGNTGYKVYTSPRKLIILGTLTIDPNKEILLIDTNSNTNIVINNNGTLNLGVPNRMSSRSASGVTAGPLYGFGTAMVSGRDGDACCWNGSVNVERGGTLALYGALLRIRGVMHLKSGANFISRDGRIFGEPPSRVGNDVLRIRVDATSGVDIQGLTVWGCQFDILSATAFTNFEGYDGRDVRVAVEASPNASNSSLRGTRINVRNLPEYRPYAQAALNNWRGAQDLRVYNSAAGSATLCVPDQVVAVTTAGQGAHGGRIYHEATITVRDEDGDPIENARVYTADTDHGNRVSVTTTGNITIDETGSHVYSNLTNAQGVLMHTVLTGMWYRRNNVSDIPGPDGNEIVDVRGKTATAGTDDFDFHIEAYGYVRASFDAVLNGDAPYTRTQILRTDHAITERSKPTVDAYTTLETAEKLYDWIYSKKANNPTFGGLGADIVARAGKTLDFGDTNVVFADPMGMPSPRYMFNSTNDTITITTRSARFTGNIRTTGTVTVHANQAISGYIADVNGISSVVAVTVEQVGNVGSAPAIVAFGPNGDVLGTNQADNGTYSPNWTLSLTPAQSQRGLRFIAKDIGYEHQVQRLDASAGGAFSVDFAEPRINELLIGGLMRVTVPPPDTSGIVVTFGVTDISAVTMTITIPDRQTRVQEIYEAVEQAFHAQSNNRLATDGFKFLAFGGQQVLIDLSPTGGDSLYLQFRGTKIDAESGATANAILQGNVGHPDRTPILADGSNPNIRGGVNIELLADAISLAVLWRDIDPDEIGAQSLAEKVLAATAAVTDMSYGNAALKVLIDAISTSVSGQQSAGITLAQLETVRDAIISSTPSVEQVVDGLMNEPIEGTHTMIRWLRYSGAVLFGRMSYESAIRRATFYRLNDDATPAVRVTYAAEGGRNTVEFLESG